MENFIQLFIELFDEAPEVQIFANTEFKNLTGWDSLVALSLIVMVSNNYGKSIDGDVIRNASTINDLYEIVDA